MVDKYKIAKPVIIQRKQTGFLPLYTEYFYSESDSIIRYISYDWEREKYGNFFKKQEIWEEESKKLNQYNSEFDIIKSTLIKQLGEPTSQDTEPQQTESTSGRGDYLTSSTVWETDNHYSKLTMIFESMTYRIRWYYTGKINKKRKLTTAIVHALRATHIAKTLSGNNLLLSNGGSC